MRTPKVQNICKLSIGYKFAGLVTSLPGVLRLLQCLSWAVTSLRAARVCNLARGLPSWRPSSAWSLDSGRRLANTNWVSVSTETALVRGKTLLSAFLWNTRTIDFISKISLISLFSTYFLCQKIQFVVVIVVWKTMSNLTNWWNINTQWWWFYVFYMTVSTGTIYDFKLKGEVFFCCQTSTILV